MANVMLRYLKFAQILNRQLSFNSVKYYPGLYLSRSYTNSKFGKSYATAAYKLALNENPGVKHVEAKSIINAKDNESVDDLLSKIDSLIRRNGRTQMKNIYKIFSLITNKEMTSSSHALYLLRSCKYCIDEPSPKRIKLVNEIWNKYQELGVEFDVRHYNALLGVHVKNRLDFNPVDILASMEDLKIEPNKDTYMLIMKKYCQDGNINGASEILEFMKDKQMTADEKVFNYLIEAHINNKDIAGAKEIVEVMRSSNLEPTDETHAILACGYAANGDKEEMISHLKQCKDFDNLHNYLRVIEALAISGNHELVDNVLSMIEHKDWYHQDLINTAVELINKNFVEIAYKLATAACTPYYNESVNIFLKQLIKVGKELPEISDYCEKIKNEGLNQNIYLVAVRGFVEYGNFSPIVDMFKKLEKSGYNVRSNSFWQLFMVVKEHKTSEGCWFILKSMTELGIPCDFRTYLEVVYPVLGVPKPDEVLQGIKQSGQSIKTAADALFLHYCNIGELDYALELIEKFPVSVSNKFDLENFIELYQHMNAESVSKYHKILKYILMEDVDSAIVSDVPGRLLTELILQRKRLLEIILDKFEDLTFSDHTFRVCEQELCVRNPARMAVLQKIKALNNARGRMKMHENLSVEDENKYIMNLKDNNFSCKSFLISRIQYHIRTKNLPRVQELLSIFDELKFEHTPLMLSNLFGLMCTASDISKAKEILDKIRSNFPDFQIEISKCIDYVGLLIKYEKFDESYEALNDFLSKPHIYSNKRDILRSIKRFNVILSSTQNSDFLKKMQSLMLSLSNELGSKKALLDPSVNIHLLRNDLKSALEEFRNIVITHRVPACLDQLLKKCITSYEKDILQQVIDLTISCAGKSYALFELAVAFIETYNQQKAAKVIQSLGSEADTKILDSICEKLANQYKLNELESLIYVTQPLNHVDRESLYCHAFRACASQNDFQRALLFFEKMKEEISEPNPETLSLLQNIFKKNNQPIPLSVISKSSSEISSIAAESTKTFCEQLKAGNCEAALSELNDLKKGYIRTLPIKTLTDLVDLCLQNKCTHKLSMNVHAMTYILDNVKEVLRPILEKYSEAGDTEKFNLLISFVPDFSLITIGFNNYFCKAFIKAGKYDTLLSYFNEHVSQKNKLFSSDAFEELLNLPELEERILNLAEKYYEFNYTPPISVVWAHYFSKENYEKANEICKKFPPSVDRVDYIVIRNIKQNGNADLAKKYVDFIKTINVRPRLKERAYGAAIDTLVLKGMYDEAADLVVDSEKQNLQLHKYYLSTLVTLKSMLEKENKHVPFSLSLNKSSGSNSDSNQD